MVLSRQTIKAQGFLDVLLHPGTQLGIAVAPLSQPSRQVLPGLLGIAPVLDPTQFLQAIIIGLTRQVIERVAKKMNVTSLPHRFR